QEDVRVARQGHAAVCHQRRVLVLGGVSEGTEFMNDCLAGASSAQLTAGALREQGAGTTSTGASDDAGSSTRSHGATALLFPP
ncbi:unnamed protein product, partial [Ectocarpus sp. 12 AP-2014]